MIYSEDVEKKERDAERAFLASLAQKVWAGERALFFDEAQRSDLCEHIAEVVGLQWTVYEGRFISAPQLYLGGGRLSYLASGDEGEATLVLSITVDANAIARVFGIDSVWASAVARGLGELAKTHVQTIRVVKVPIEGGDDFRIELPPTPPPSGAVTRIMDGIADIGR